MSHIHYKFQSSNEHDTITFDGLSISLSDLRSSIHQKAKLSQSDEYALQITNAQTKEGKWQGIGIVDHHRHVFHSYGSANIPLHVVLFILLLDWHHLFCNSIWLWLCHPFGLFCPFYSLVYKNDSDMIPKNTSVTVTRVPVVKAFKGWVFL